MRLQIFSFFAGAGFLDLGFEDSGYEVVFVNEVHKPFVDAYQYSRAKRNAKQPRYGFFVGSIEELLTKRRIAMLKGQMAESRSSGALVGFIGGPPCPDFSIAGKNRGHIGENGKLSEIYIDLIIKTKPDFFLFENVKGLYRTKQHRVFFDTLKRKLERRGYVLQEKLINSLEYGAPQDRQRIILIGMLNPKNRDFLKPSDWSRQAPYSKEEVDTYEWPDIDMPQRTRRQPPDIAVELTVQHWFDKNDVSNHPNQKHAFTPRGGQERIAFVDEGDVSRKSYKRLHRWRYSPTTAYGNNEVHIHPYFPRRLSAAEALAIQSLPRDFELPDTMTLSEMFKAVGNGVPYLAARGIGKMLKKSLVREFP